MADKQQLIRIKFPVDTTELRGATVAAQQAQQATDALRNSAVKFGNDGAAAASKYKGGIGGVKAELEKTKTLIDLTARSDTKRLNDLISRYKILKSEVDTFNKQLITTNTLAQQNTKSFGNLFQAVSLVVGVAIIKQTVQIALEMAKLAGNVEGVKRAFDRLPGSVVLLDQLREATQGTVTDFELMQRSLQAKNFRIPLEQLGKLFEFATVRAQQTGQSVDYLINSIVFGLGFQSIRRLDNVGISAAELRDTMKELGVSLNEAFNIVVNREIEKMGGLLKTSATEVEILNANFETLRQEISKQLTSSNWIAGLSEALNALRVLVKSMPAGTNIFSFVNPIIGINNLREWNAAVEQTLISEQLLKNASEELQVIQGELGKTAQQQVDGLIQETIARRENIRLTESQLTKKQAEINLNDLQNKSNAATRVQYLQRRDELVSELQGIRNRLQIDQIVVGELAKMIRALVTPQGNQLGLIEAKLAEIEAVSDDIKTAKSVGEIHNLNNELAILNGELEDLKAFGTTKQFLEVNGQLKLVPVIAPKGASKTIEPNKIDFSKQLDDFVKNTLLGLGPYALKISLDYGKGFNSKTPGLIKDIPPIKLPAPIIPMTEWDKFVAELEERQQEIGFAMIDNTANIITSQFDMEVQSVNERIRLLKDFYDEQQLLAGNNEKYKAQLRLREERDLQRLTRERADREKKAALASILVNTAVAVIKALASYDYVGALLAGAEGAAQYAVASRARYYAKGKVNIDGPGTGTSDSIPARISKGESVIAAKPTQRSLKLLESINTGKIDDRILQRLHITQQGVKVMPYDDSKIIEAIKGQQFPDVVTIGSQVYEKKKASDGFSVKLRRKIFSKNG